MGIEIIIATALATVTVILISLAGVGETGTPVNYTAKYETDTEICIEETTGELNCTFKQIPYNLQKHED